MAALGVKECNVRVFRDLYFSFRTGGFSFQLLSQSDSCWWFGSLDLETSPKLVCCRRCIASSGCSGVGEITLACNLTTAMSSNQELEGRRREPKKPPFKFLVPLIYAPVLPLIRISLKRQPVLRDRLFGIVLAAALFHGGYLVTDLYDQESK